MGRIEILKKHEMNGRDPPDTCLSVTREAAAETPARNGYLMGSETSSSGIWVYDPPTALLLACQTVKPVGRI